MYNYINIIKPFDIIFCKEKSIIGSMIKNITKSEYNHVAVAIDMWTIVEIQYKQKLSIKHIPYNCKDYDIYECTILNKLDKDAMYSYIYSHIGQKYDIREILRALGLRIFNDNANKLICSEFVNDLFVSGGLDLFNLNTVVTPESLLHTKYFRKKNIQR